VAEWSPTPGEVQTAKVMVSGAFGSMLFIYLRHPGTVLRAFLLVCFGMGMAVIFAEMVADILGINVVPVAAGIGLVGKTTAEAALRAVEKMDLSGWLSKGKE